jgi:hypothetical protein
MPRPRYSAGFALTEHTERFRWRPTDIKWRWKNSIFSSKVIFTQLSRGNIVTKCLLLSFLKLECQTNLFLGNYLYSGGARYMDNVWWNALRTKRCSTARVLRTKLWLGRKFFFGGSESRCSLIDFLKNPPYTKVPTCRSYENRYPVPKPHFLRFCLGPDPITRHL